MERTQSGLFAMNIAALTPEIPVGGPVGAYDPVEQLWRDEGTVVAHTHTCTDDLIGVCLIATGCDFSCCKACCLAHQCADAVLVLCVA